MLSRKGSLEIGINTIVILVIAMVLLGLGIGFIRNLFQNAEELPALIDVSQLGNPPTSSDPILLSPSEIEIKRGDSKQVKVGVYNNKGSDYNFAVAISQCTGTDPNRVPIVESLLSNIRAGDSAAFQVIVRAAYENPTGGNPETMGAGKYICNMQALSVDANGQPLNDNNGNPVASYSTQFILTVVT